MTEFLRARKRLIVPAATLAGVLLLLWLARPVAYCGWDFHNSLWGPVNMLVNGQTPYTLTPPYGPFPGVWMPSTLGLAFLLGYLTCDTAAKLWLLASFAGFGWIIWLIAGRRWPSPVVLGMCVLALLLFPPLWVHIILGQFSMLFAALMVTAVFLPGSWRWAPLLLAAGLTKPQLAILIYPGFFFHTWRAHGLPRAARLALGTALLAALMTVPLFSYYPNWAADFFSITFDNLGKPWNLPTLFVQLPQMIGPAGRPLWAVIFLAALAVSLRLWLRPDPRPALLASLALTPMVTPYASSWDFLLMLPAFFGLLIHLKRLGARIVVVGGMAAVIVLQFAARWQRDISDDQQWWIPPALITLYLLSIGLDHLLTLRQNAQFSPAQATLQQEPERQHS